MPAAQVGAYLIWPTALNMATSYIFGARNLTHTPSCKLRFCICGVSHREECVTAFITVEALVLKRQWLTLLGVRKVSTVLGSLFSAFGLCTFGLSRSPVLAALAYCAVALGQVCTLGSSLSPS